MRTKILKLTATCLAAANLHAAYCAANGNDGMQTDPAEHFDYMQKILDSMPPQEKTAPPMEIDAATVEEYNRFSTELFGVFESQNDGGNIVFSNISAMQILTACMLGLDGESAETFFGASAFFKNKEDAAEAAAQVSAYFGNRRDATTASGVWVSDAYKIKPAFAKAFESVFSESVMPFNFKSREKFGQVLNRWAKNNSLGRITEMPNPAGESTAVIMANISSFFADWENPFDPLESDVGIFRSPDGNVEAVFMSQRSGAAFLYEDEKFFGLRMKYDEKSDASIVIITAADQKDLRAIGCGHVRAAMESKRLSDLPFKFPKFKFTGSQNMLEALRKINPDMKAPNFSGIADGISSKNPYRIFSVSDIVVNEAGTQAKSASIGDIEIGDPSAPILFDTPFKFFIVDNKTGLILFMGIVNNPSGNRDSQNRQ